MIDTEILYLRDQAVKLRHKVTAQMSRMKNDNVESFDHDTYRMMCRVVDHLRDVEALLHQACGSTA